MTLAEVRRRYGLSFAAVRRMVEYGYTRADDTTAKLKATRSGSGWDVTQESLDRWAADYDGATLADMRAAFAKGRTFVQFFPNVNQQIRRSCARLTAAGQLQCGDVICQDSGIPHLTCFPPGECPLDVELLPLTDVERAREYLNLREQIDMSPGITDEDLERAREYLKLRERTK